jgi:hypothetical protein
VVGSGG